MKCKHSKGLKIRAAEQTPWKDINAKLKACKVPKHIRKLFKPLYKLGEPSLDCYFEVQHSYAAIRCTITEHTSTDLVYLLVDKERITLKDCKALNLSKASLKLLFPLLEQHILVPSEVHDDIGGTVGFARTIRLLYNT